MSNNDYKAKGTNDLCGAKCEFCINRTLTHTARFLVDRCTTAQIAEMQKYYAPDDWNAIVNEMHRIKAERQGG